MSHFSTICSLFSYAGFLVVDQGWCDSVDEAGYLAGWLGSALVLGRLPTGVAWGALSDARGRRPALLLTFFGILVGNVAFGLCTTLRQALVVRFVFLGMGNGWVSLSATYVSEVAGAKRQNRVQGYVLSGGTFTQLMGPAAAALLYREVPTSVLGGRR